jgi:glycosyltransferase involved in cell wall biosynthesis
MNIAVFASAFFPHLGGVEEAVRQLAHANRRKGHKTIVLTNRWPRDLPEVESYQEIPLYRLPFRVPEGSFKARLNFRLTHGKIVRRMLGILRSHKIDLIHVQCVSANGWYAHLAAKALRLPLVVTTQGERMIDASGLYQRSDFMNGVLRQLLAGRDFITACSDHTLADMEQYWARPFGPKSRTIYNGIELADFDNVTPYAHPRPFILGLGRLVHFKGFDLLLKAFAQSGIQSHDLLIAGEGPERAALEQLAGELNLGDRVRFIGRAERSTAVSLFAGCSFFVLPSRGEPQGIVALEAMASGKAIVATAGGGVPEIVTDNQVGLLVPMEEIPALAKAMARLAGDAELGNRLGTAGRAKAGQFGWDSIAEQYLAVYRECGVSAGPESSEKPVARSNPTDALVGSR